MSEGRYLQSLPLDAESFPGIRGEEGGERGDTEGLAEGRGKGRSLGAIRMVLGTRSRSETKSPIIF